MALDPGRREYVFHYEEGGQEYWFGQGGDNIRLLAGAGGREVGYSALACLAEPSYKAEKFGASLGLKRAQDGVATPYGYAGANYRTIYGKAWAQAVGKIKPST